jgi:hypothetical protein
MDELFRQIRAALAADLYYLALYTSLTIPDVCGALSSSDGHANGARYADWFNRWVGPKYTGIFTGQECWYFRCSLLHQGTTQHPQSGYNRIIFIEPGPGTRQYVAHRAVLMDALMLDVRIFCSDIMDGAERWLRQAANTPEYQANYAAYAARHPNGLAPYMVGIPVVG